MELNTEEKADNLKDEKQQSEEKTVGAEIVSPDRDIFKITGPKKVGRPRRLDKTKLKKLTIEINEEIYKALMFYKIDQDFYVNGYIEELLKANVPEKYFKMNQ